MKTWQEEREAKQQVALLRWLATIRQWEHDLVIVKQLQGETTEKSLCILGDYFAGKAPATLLKRVASISFFCSYLHSVGTKFPSGEGHLYEYMCVSKINKEPCSRRKSVMEAISFVRFVLSVDECAPMVTSRRCMGAAKALLGGRKQAAPFLMTERTVCTNVSQKTRTHGTGPWQAQFFSLFTAAPGGVTCNIGLVWKLTGTLQAMLLLRRLRSRFTRRQRPRLTGISSCRWQLRPWGFLIGLG